MNKPVIEIQDVIRYPEADLAPEFSIMAIHPRHVKSILQGVKYWEYRKSSMIGLMEGDVYIYATSPLSKIVGRIRIGGEYSGPKENVWEFTRAESGIDGNEFKDYFQDYWMAYAARITYIKLIKGPTLQEIRQKCMFAYNTWQPPQTWTYMNGMTKLRATWEI